MINSIIGLLLALGILVTVHEFGHFWVARKCGVKVLRFSVGFGAPIWRRMDKHGTEFVVAWIPLGGYVKMLDEREGDVPDDQLSQAFTRKAPWQKIAIALAGPLANFLFAITAFSLMHMVGTTTLAPIVDQPEAGSVAAAEGIQRGDRILSVDGEAIQSFSDLGLALAARVGDSGVIGIEFDRNGLRQSVQLPVDSWLSSAQSPNPIGDLGLYPKLPPVMAAIGGLESEGAAAQSGMKVGDLVTRAGGQSVSAWEQWVDFVRAHPDMPLDIVVLRDQQTLNLTLTPAAKTLEDGSVIGYVGAAAQQPSWPEEQLTTIRYWPLQAIVKGVDDTRNMVVLSYQMLWKMVSGKVSLKQIGGPISMAQMAGVSVESGFESFVGFLALISISLGIVNLLPVPVLDGGHVVIHSVEWILRRPLSERMQLIGMQVGMAFIITLMCLAFFNDIGRLM
ncbi:RIP metalloprotease RseP [Reinekea sp. G2M2-21]|uniref:RIP metalloprotease RseP n=1 Tax=Reinekea sp. G2M2-21 TaxID=2788942 RepID=UPI0018A9C385|nr:RIP metalloprotease RseP [Reinekea sp. G2M2-21]